MKWRWQLAQWLESRWWKRYLQGKDWDQYLAWKRAYWQGLLAQAGVQPSAVATAADLGCGPAGIFIALPQARVAACDPLLPTYERVLPFSRSQFPQVQFFACKLEEYVSPAAGYQLVCCLNAINHVQHLPLAVDRVVQALAPGGTLLFSIDAHRWPWLRYPLRWLPLDALHPHQHTLAEYEAMLTQRGLLVQRRVLLKREAFFNHYLLVATQHPEL